MKTCYQANFSFAELKSILKSLYSTQTEMQDVYKNIISKIQDIEYKKQYEKDLEILQNAIDQLVNSKIITI